MVSRGDAQFSLGLLYAKGQGVPRDDVQAYMWFELSAAQDDQSAVSNSKRQEPRRSGGALNAAPRVGAGGVGAPLGRASVALATITELKFRVRLLVRRTMTNLLAEAINCNDGDQAAKIIQDALGVETDDVANYCFPKIWPTDREQRALIIGEWLQTEARYLA
jgi:TPR repeat protein